MQARLIIIVLLNWKKNDTITIWYSSSTYNGQDPMNVIEMMV
jgi:hypothetical protein